jgi:folylpolyglutamate synthase/dihydropteroate synthase
LVAALRELIECENLIMILGASADHVTKGLLEALCSSADRIIVTQTHHPKAASPVWIQEQVAELGFDADVSPSVPEALALALASAQPADLICFAGSVFTAAEARVAWFRHQGLDLPPSDPS